MKNWTPLQVFLIGFSTVAEPLFVEQHLPVAAYVHCLKEKEWKK